AVMGTEVPLLLLQTVMELPEETLRVGFSHLQDAEFLYEASLFPELVYTFKHALTQEGAYATLLHERRRGVHPRTVQALDALAGEGLCRAERAAPCADAVAPAEQAARNPKSGHTDYPISTPTPRTVPVRLSRQRVVEQVERLAHHALQGEVWAKA